MHSITLQIQRQLVTKGWAVFDSDSPIETRRTLRNFGEVVARERIAHLADPRTALVADESMRLHSGNPGIRSICWHCVSADPQGSAILLNPVWLALLELPAETKEALRQITMGVRFPADADANRCAVLRNLGAWGTAPACEGVFFSPWLWREGANEHLDALVTKMKAIGNERIQLKPGQVLLIDNARVLHGLENSPNWHRTLLLRHQLWGGGADLEDEW
jgi:hypothetical protein